MSRRRAVRRWVPVLCAAVLLVGASAAAAEGTLTFALHFSPVTRWLDPAEGESTITPYLLLPTGIGPRVEDILANPIPGFYMSPYEDLKLKRP